MFFTFEFLFVWILLIILILDIFFKLYENEEEIEFVDLNNSIKKNLLKIKNINVK